MKKRCDKCNQTCCSGKPCVKTSSRRNRLPPCVSKLSKLIVRLLWLLAKRETLRQLQLRMPTSWLSNNWRSSANFFSGHFAMKLKRMGFFLVTLLVLICTFKVSSFFGELLYIYILSYNFIFITKVRDVFGRTGKSAKNFDKMRRRLRCLAIHSRHWL